MSFDMSRPLQSQPVRSLRHFLTFLKGEFVSAPVPEEITQRYAHKFIRPIHRMEEEPYRALRSILVEKLSVEECRFLFFAMGISVDDAYDAGRIANISGKPLLYVATVLRGAECVLENNRHLRPHLQAILDLRFDDTLDLAETYAAMRANGSSRNQRMALIRAYLASLSELEQAALKICYGSAWEACLDVTARHYGVPCAKPARFAGR